VDILVLICYIGALDAEGMAFVGPRLSDEFTLRAIGRGCRVQVLVRDNNVDQALKALKKKMQREGIFREMKLRGHYE
jgi:small subunit ribosomal protein S21